MTKDDELLIGGTIEGFVYPFEHKEWIVLCSDGVKRLIKIEIAPEYS